MFDAHPATSDADRTMVMRIAQPAYESTAPWEVYAAQRLASSLRRRATWWLAREGGEPVASLLCHHLTLARGEERVRAYGLGSVAVLPSHQRQGLGTRLCQLVADHEGCPGLLFSAVPPRVYEGIGFRTLPAFEHHSRDLGALSRSGPPAALTPIDPLREQARLAEVWAEGQPGWRLARDEARWLASLDDNPDDLWFLCPGGYVRLVIGDTALEVVELFSTDRAGVLRACAAIAAASKVASVTGWFAPDPFVTEHFEDRGRGTTLPMAHGIDDAASAWFSSADYF